MFAKLFSYECDFVNCGLVLGPFRNHAEAVFEFSMAGWRVDSGSHFCVVHGSSGGDVVYSPLRAV